MKCCLCGGEITSDNSTWKEGNNAEPVKKGRCCDKCNEEIVIPERINILAENQPENYYENR